MTELKPKAQIVWDTANAAAVLSLQGEWTVRNLPQAERVELGQLPRGAQKLLINGSGLEEVDTSGAWLIVKAIRSLGIKAEDTQWVGFPPSLLKLVQMIDRVKHDANYGRRRSYTYNALVNLGKYCETLRKETAQLISFFGQICVAFVRILINPRRLRFKSVVYHANHVGINAMPIIILLGISISFVLGYQGANQLRPFGQMPYTINLVAISMLREMGVLITAIMASGRSCSAFAAQIGVMQMNDEVAAMRTLGLDPVELLVLPRVLGILIALPVLTVVADAAGLVGTYFVATAYLDMSYAQFMARLQPSISDMTIYIGLIKAPVFAVIIGVIGCFHGLQVRTSATELGHRTTTAVVQAIFLVVVIDAIFSILFTLLNV